MRQLLTLLAVLVLTAVPARAASAAPPSVRVHGTATWTPAMEVALDEVAMVWAGQPRKDTTPPVLVDGASLPSAGGDTVAVTVRGVTALDELVATARALRAANPGWETRLVLYTPEHTRSARTRRLLTGEIAVVAEDGTVARERVADPLATLDAARAIAARAGVRAAEPVADAPDYLQARLKRKMAKLLRQDQPNERQQFFADKRVAPGERQLQMERYVEARNHMRLMPLHSTAGGNVLHPSSAALGMSLDTAAAFLGSWTPLGPGNVGGRTRALVIDPGSVSTMYAAGVAGGVWKTTNGGASWTPLTDTLLPNLAVASLDMDPTNSQVLYAGTGEGFFNLDAVRGAGIFKTTDGGLSWNALASTTPPGTSDFNFVNKIKALSGGVVLAATGTGLLRSIDGGATWTKVINAAGVSGCFDVAPSPAYVLASCGTFAQGTVHRSASVDASAPFTAVLGPSGSSLVAPTMGRTTISIAPSNPAIVYALAASIAGGQFNRGLDGVYKSTDSGVTWSVVITNTNPTKLNTLLLTNPVYAAFADCGFPGPNQFFNQGWYDNVIAVDPADPNKVWAGGIDLFRSDDGGANWGLASFWWTDSSDPGAFAHADQHAIVFHPGYNGTTNQTMFVGNDGGIFKTTTARGTTTTNVCDPDVPAALTGRWTDLNNNYGVTQFYHGLPYPGPDGGNTFIGGAQDNGTLRGSTALGINGWQMIQGGDGGYVAVDFSNSNTVYAETTGLSIAKSTNGGAGFGPATSGITNSGFQFITPFMMSPNNSQILWTGGAQMWRTVNGASNWGAASTSFTSLGCGRVSAVAVAPDNGAPGGVGDNLVMAGTEGGCVMRTTAGLTATGATGWTQVMPAGSGYVSWIAFDPSDAGTVYVTHSSFNVGHVFKSIDGGVTFSNIDGSGLTGIPNVPTHTVVVAPGNPGKLYAGTDLGVFSSDDGGASWAVENSGFANVITEALAVGQVGGVDHLFAFTHGRGVFRVPLPPSLADLAVTVATVPTGTTVAPGANVSVTNTIKNLGAQASSVPFDVTFELQPVDGSGADSGSPVQLPAATRTIATLAGNGTDTAVTAISVPTDTAAGSYKIRVKADEAGAATEDTNSGNDVRSTSTFTVAIPDLTVSSVTFTPAASGNGMSLSVTHTLRNLALSPATAPLSVSGIYLASNTSFSSVVAPLGTASAPVVNGNITSAAITKSFAIPAAGVVPPGRYFVLVRANDNSGFIETPAANNVAASASSLIVGPDLLVTAGSTPTGASPGTNVSVTYTVKNQGGVAAPVNVGFTLVPVTALGAPTGAGDVAVGPDGNSITLGAGATSAPLSSSVFLPADLPNGFYKLRFTADPTGAVSEADEANNDFPSTTILNVVRPDLTVPSVTFAPAASRANGSVTVTHIVKNVSPAPGTAPASISSLFLSSANNSVIGAIPLGNVSVPQLLGFGTATVAKPVTIPVGTPTGQYFVLAFADAPDAIVEPIPDASNLGSSVARLIVGPDLSITAGTAATGVAPGTNLSVTYTLRNGGGEAANNFVVGFTLVRVAPSGPDIALTATRTITTALNAGVMRPFTDSLPIPSDTPGGTYKLRITVDATTVVTEANELNNEFLTATINVAQANLKVQSVTFTPVASRANGSITVTHVVKNFAPAPGTAAPTVSSLYLNSVNSSVTGGIFLGNASVPQIVGSGMATVVKPVTIPLGTAPGPYFVLARADAGETLPELVDTDNLGNSVTPLIVGPDLTVSAATSAAGVATGMNLSVNYTVKNLGGEAATNFDVAFKLVPVTAAGVPSGAPEVLLTPSRTVGGLAAGAMQPFTSAVLIPAGTAADNYKVRVIADFTGTVMEANESNNDLLTGIVKVGRPDLTVPSVTFTPAAVATGGNVSVTHVVKNATALNGNAPASQSAIYLSQNASFAGVLGQLATVNVPAIASNGMTAPLLRAVNVGTLGTGRYFFVVRADDPGALIEQGEGNNIGISATGLIVGPDAAVTAATTAVTGAGPGTNVSVSYTLKNLGVAPTVSFDVGFSVIPVNAGGAPTGSALDLGTVRSGLSLTAGQTLPLTNNALLPANLDAGAYRIGVTISGFSTPDANPANDTLLTSGVLSVFRPDLVINSVGFTPAAVVVGGNLSATHTVRNATLTIGNAPASLSSIHISSTPNPAGIVFSYPMSIPVGTLLPGAVSGTITTLLPLGASGPNLAPGKYFLGFMTDGPNLIVEANESNNVLFAATAFRVGPDPAVTAASLTPAGVTPGANVSVTRTLTNLGATPTGAFTVDYVLEPIDLAGPPDVTLLRVNEPSLGPVGTAGATRSGTVSLAIPPGTTPGQYKILVVVDADGTFAEADKTNNVRVTNTFSVLLPDLVMSVFTPPTTLIAGRSAALTNTVKNNTAPPATTGPFQVGVYLSTDATIDTLSDTLVGNRSVASLAGAGTNSTAVTITVPPVMGNFFLGAVADHLNTVVEANESNNVTIKPVAVVPDLVRTNVVSSMTFNIGPPSSICFVQAFGLGQALVTTGAQTGGSFSGGKMTFFDDQGGSDTINFSGTVNVAGNVAGMFTLSRVGGGGGSGSGSFTGTAFLGGPADPGALSLHLTGTFTVSSGGTCPVTADVVFNGNGPLTGTSLISASLTAGATGNVTVGFTTTDPWPAGGELRVTFPSGFDPFFASFVGATGPDGTFFPPNVVGQTVSLSRTGGSTFVPGSVSITLGGIRNPPVSGPTGSFSLASAPSFGQAAINTGTVPGVTITPGTLPGPSVMPASLVVGETGNVTVGFDTNNPWPFDGTIRIDFPAGFDLSAPTFVSASGPPGAFAISQSGRTVTLTRSGGFTYTGTGVGLTLGNIQNPAAPGTTGTFTLTLTDGGGAAIDIGTVPGVTITP